MGREPRRGWRLAALLLGGFGTASAGDPGAPEPHAGDPYVLVLGTAQDGGLPQIGCRGECCERVRRDPAALRLVTSLLLAEPSTGHRWLFDASPDLKAQLERAQGHPSTRVVEGPRPPLFEGIFLTHAHMGHYGGLLQLGREAYDVRALPVHGSERMLAFLSQNAPWSLLVDRQGIVPEVIAADREIELSSVLHVRALEVPHRPEFSDTLAFVVRGPNRSLLYLPDIDKWERWDRRIEDVIAKVDYALLDGSFAADGEIPGRSMADIPHPFLVESLARFAALPAQERAKVHFTHLNHTNPAADPASEAARTVREAGCHVAFDGQVFEL